MLVTSVRNQPSFQPQQTQAQKQQEQQLALLQRVVRKFYFVHLIVIALTYTYLLIQQPHFKFSFTFVLLGIYCYMIIWNWLINFFLVIINRQNLAVVFNRVIIRFIIMLFFPLGIVTLIIQNYLGIQIVLILILYLCFISFLFFLYEIYGCTCGQQKNPKYIFEHNDLHVETEKVWDIRRKYNKQIITHWEEHSLTPSQRIEQH